MPRGLERHETTYLRFLGHEVSEVFKEPPVQLSRFYSLITSSESPHGKSLNLSQIGQHLSEVSLYLQSIAR